MKRTRQVTVIYYRRRVVSRNRTAADCCPVCGSPASVTVVAAALLDGLSSRTLRDWIEDGKLHTRQRTDGRLLICHESLLKMWGSPCPDGPRLSLPERIKN